MSTNCIDKSVLALIGAVAICANPSLAGAQGLATNDEQVIDAALKTIFEKSAWNTWWTNGDFPVLYPLITNELPRPRSSLSRKLDDFIHPLERGDGQWIKGSNDLQVLKEHQDIGRARFRPRTSQNGRAEGHGS